MKPFFDSNVVLYAVSRDDQRADIAVALLDAGGVVSVQVLNEVVHVARRKGGHDRPIVHDVIDLICERCRVVALTEEIHRAALMIAQRYGFTIFDGNIWAAALAAGCTTLYSEDMQHGQTIDGLTLLDPFR